MGALRKQIRAHFTRNYFNSSAIAPHTRDARDNQRTAHGSQPPRQQNQFSLPMPLLPGRWIFCAFN
jgi:hypothetical protein